MNPAIMLPREADGPASHATTRRQVRGSTLLLGGRLLSIAVNFAVQLLLVRYLSKSDFGAFQYALSIVVFGEAVATLGMDQALTRLLPIYHERGEHHKLFGIILLVAGSIVLFGFAIVSSVWIFREVLAQWLINDQQTIALLLILIALSPVQALDSLIIALFAVFASPRSIFFRRYVLAPGLKLVVVLLLLLLQSDVFFLAGGYLTATFLGVVLYTVVLFHALRDQELLQHFDFHSLVFPVREVFAFAFPLLTTELMYVLVNTSAVMLLAHFRDTAEVAALRAVQPAAKLNQMVLGVFGILFTPLASRLFARDDRDGIRDLYWQTAIWTAVISFPVFALSFSLARPFTLLLYGEQYASSAPLLALLSLGYYFNAALGPNGQTLRVFGKVRYTIAVNVLAAAINVAANLLLIPRYGALGAALGTAGTMVAHNVFKQAGLRFGTGIGLFEWRYFRMYLAIGLSAFGLLLFQLLASPPAYVSLTLAAAVSVLVIGLNHQLLDIRTTFPEVLRLPLARRFLGS